EQVALFPTCLVEYQAPAIGKAAVAVLEHNGFHCTRPEGQVCCGMPWVDAGAPVVVLQPTCAYTLKFELPAFLGTDDARRVASHVYDAAEYLMARDREAPLDRRFTGRTYDSIVWHAACHQRAQQVG